MDGAPTPIAVSVGTGDLRPVLKGLAHGIAEAWDLGDYDLASALDAMLDISQVPADPNVSVEFQLTWPILRIRVEAASTCKSKYIDLAGWLFTEVTQ